MKNSNKKSFSTLIRNSVTTYTHPSYSCLAGQEVFSRWWSLSAHREWPPLGTPPCLLMSALPPGKQFSFFNEKIISDIKTETHKNELINCWYKNKVPDWFHYSQYTSVSRRLTICSILFTILQCLDKPAYTCIHYLLRITEWTLHVLEVFEGQNSTTERGKIVSPLPIQ